MAESKKAVLSGRKLFIGIPCHDGRLNVKTAYSLAQLMPEAMRLGVAVTLSDISNCSLITLARNSLVHEFLKTDCTELLFIDSDVVVTPNDIFRLMAQSSGKDVTAGAYPRRSKDKKFFTDLYWTEDNNLEFEGSLLRVLRVGTGFMLIRRNVVETLAAKADKYLGQDGVGQVANVFEFSMLDGKFVGEDYTFCDKARTEGFKVWVDVEINLPHMGTEEFTNDFKNEVVVPLIQDFRKQKLKVANG